MQDQVWSHGLLLCVGACWKGPGPGTGQGWPWTTGVTLQTVSCGLASLQVPISFRASLHLCYKEVSNCTNLGGDVFRMRKKSHSLFTKDGNSLPFSHLADAQILGNSLSAWRRGQEICSPGVRRSVLCLQPFCNNCDLCFYPQLSSTYPGVSFSVI